MGWAYVTCQVLGWLSITAGCAFVFIATVFNIDFVLALIVASLAILIGGILIIMGLSFKDEELRTERANAGENRNQQQAQAMYLPRYTEDTEDVVIMSTPRTTTSEFRELPLYEDGANLPIALREYPPSYKSKDVVSEAADVDITSLSGLSTANLDFQEP